MNVITYPRCWLR